MTAKPAGKKRTPTTAAGWRKNNEVPMITLPSGNTARIRKIGIQAFLKMGIIPNSLMPFVMDGVNKGKVSNGELAENTLDGDAMAAMLGDEKALADMVAFYDNMIIAVFAEPVVSKIPIDPQTGKAVPLEDRDDSLLYCDEIDDEDKTYIFSLATGGTTDVEQFRAERDSAMELVQGRANVQLPAE